MNFRYRSVLASLSLVALVGACAERLATLPPSDRYLLSTDMGAPKLTSDQRDFVDRINKELAKYGQSATPGNYEMQIAALAADISLSKGWHGSGSKVSDERVVPGTSPTAVVPDGGTGGYLYPVSDEPDDRLLKSIHWPQRFISHGVYPDFVAWTGVTDYAVHHVDDDMLEKAVLNSHPVHVWGKLKVGVALLPNGGDNQRIYTFVLRDERILFSEAPPRRADPGTSFTVAGQIVDQTLSTLTLGLLGADGQVTSQDITTREDGHFSASVQIPATAGRYIFTVTRTSGGEGIVLNVPIFAGVPLTPWPIWAPPRVEPPDSARTYAKNLAQGINDYRTAHGLQALPISAELSKVARTFSNARAAAWGRARKGDPEMARFLGEGPNKNEWAEAGYDPRLLFSQYGCLNDDAIPGFQANFPNGALQAAAITSPRAQQIGVGVARVPKADTEDSNVFCGIWVLSNTPAPPAVEVPPSATPEPPPPPPPATTPAKSEKAADTPASPSPEPANPPAPTGAAPAPVAPAAPAAPAAPTPK